MVKRFVEELMKKAEEQYELEHNIFCPHCGKKQSKETMYENCVTYWGEGDDVTISCDYCDKDFIVTEKVDRTFEVSLEAEK